MKVKLMPGCTVFTFHEAVFMRNLRRRSFLGKFLWFIFAQILTLVQVTFSFNVLTSELSFFSVSQSVVASTKKWKFLNMQSLRHNLIFFCFMEKSCSVFEIFSTYISDHSINFDSGRHEDRVQFWIYLLNRKPFGHELDQLKM